MLLEIKKGLTYEFLGTVRHKVQNILGENFTWFTKAFALDSWVASILICSQLVLASVQKFSKRKIVVSVVRSYFFWDFQKVTRTSFFRFITLLININNEWYRRNVAVTLSTPKMTQADFMFPWKILFLSLLLSNITVLFSMYLKVI